MVGEDMMEDVKRGKVGTVWKIMGELLFTE